MSMAPESAIGMQRHLLALTSKGAAPWVYVGGCLLGGAAEVEYIYIYICICMCVYIYI